MTAHTATVEALTAEVRVLMVGSRQITLSVYRQLDEYDLYADLLDGFEPFGRVRSGTRYDHWTDDDRPVKREAAVEFVGRRKDTGELTRLVVMPGDLRRGGEPAADREIVNGWEKTLPLIVLAGLR